MKSLITGIQKSPASLLMFAMITIALASSQAHENSRAQATIGPVIDQIRSTMADIDELQINMDAAARLSEVGKALTDKRSNKRNKP